MERQDLSYPVPRLQRPAALTGCFCCCCGWLHFWFAYYVNEGAEPSRNSNAQRRSKRRLGRDRKSKSSPYYECNQYCKNCTNVPVHTERVTPEVANIRPQPPNHAGLPSSAFFKPIRSNIPLERSALAALQRSVSPIKVPAIRACKQKMPDCTTRPPCGKHSEKYCHASYDNYITF